MVHVKDIPPPLFASLKMGRVRFLLLKEHPNEPQFSAGDFVALNERNDHRHVALAQQYTGDCLLFQVNFVLRDCDCLTEGSAALGLSDALVPQKLEL